MKILKSKKIISFLMILTMMFSTACSVHAEESNNTLSDDALTIVLQIGNPMLTVNGGEQAIDEDGTTPLIEQGRNLLPIRGVVETMGGRFKNPHCLFL